MFSSEKKVQIMLEGLRGEIQSGQGKRHVLVNWNTNTAILSLSITKTSAFGCSGSAVSFLVQVDNTSLAIIRVVVEATDESRFWSITT